MTAKFDFAIIGAGMAGASLAAELAPGARVLLLEAERRAGYHATGRSAAFWTESYGGPAIQPLTTASGAWLRERGFLKPRGALTIARADQRGALDRFAAAFAGSGIAMTRLERGEIAAMVPGLREEWKAAVYEPDCCDIDVAGVHQCYLAAALRQGPELWTSARVSRATRFRGEWTLVLEDGRQAQADILIDAAGAWADEVSSRAGLGRLGITPLRRTMIQARCRPAPEPGLPLVLDVAEQFYFKPESGKLWLSPHDETPSEPCDAAPEEIDVALAIARLGQVVDWEVEQVEHRWAGLRSFAPDRLPVYGFDPREPGFFWFAGQGGSGIQTAPAAADLARRLLLGEDAGAIDPKRYSPERFKLV